MTNETWFALMQFDSVSAPALVSALMPERTSPLYGTLHCAALFVGVLLVAAGLESAIEWVVRVTKSQWLARLLRVTAFSLALVDCVVIVVIAAIEAYHLLEQMATI